MLYTQKHLKKVVQPKDLEKHTHGLTTEQIKKLPEWLADPVMIYDSLSRQDSLVVVTSEIDIDNEPIIVSVRPSGNGNYNLRRVSSNFITSVYGRENFDRNLELELQADNILNINKQKSQELFSVLGLQSSQGLNILDSDVIIHQSRNIVKGTQQEDIEYKNNSVTQQDIDILRSIEPRKSVLNFTAEELQLTKDWAERFENDIHKKIAGL